MAILQRLPIGDSAVQWSRSAGAVNYALVDDPIGSPDDDSTYTYALTQTYKDLFSFAPFNVPSGSTITHVRVYGRFRRIDAGGSYIVREVLRVGGVDSVGPVQQLLVGAYFDKSYTWTTNPRTGQPWAVVDINGTGAYPLQAFGYECIGFNKTVRCTQIYIEVSGIFYVGMEASAASSSNVTGSLSVTRGLAGGLILAQSTVTGLVKVAKKFIGTVTAQSLLGEPFLLTLILKLTRKLFASFTTTSTVTGRLKTSKGLVGTVTTTCTVTGSLTKDIPIAGTITATSSVSGLVKVVRGLAGTVTANSSITSRIYSFNELISEIIVASSVTGQLSVTKELSGSIIAESSATGVSLVAAMKLAGAITVQSTVNASAKRLRDLTGQVSCSSAVTGDITVMVLLVGSITVSSILACGYHLIISKKLSGAISLQSSVTGLLKRYKSLVSSITAASNLTANLVIDVYYVGSTSASSTVEGQLSTVKKLQPRVISIVSTANGPLRVERKLAVTVVAQSIVNGNVIFRVARFIIVAVDLLPIFEQGITISPWFESTTIHSPVFEDTKTILPV